MFLSDRKVLKTPEKEDTTIVLKMDRLSIQKKRSSYQSLFQ